MEPRFIDKATFTVVGVDLPAAGSSPALIMYGWIALAARREQIPGGVEPQVLYGIWHQAAGHPGPEKTSYLVGVQVKEGTPVPAGLTALTVPGGRWAVFTHRGHVGRIGETYGQVGPWFHGRARADGDNGHRDAPTVEVYDTSVPITDDYSFAICEPVHW